jgi:amino acid transporter
MTKERSVATGETTARTGSELEGGLQPRAIGFVGALALSIAAMGPLLGALGVAPLIVSQAGFSAPFIFVLCWIAMAAVALTIGRFSRVFPWAASIYSYISHGLGERLGFLSAWLSFSYYIAFVPLLLTGFGIFAEQMGSQVLSIEIDWWIWALVAAAIVTALSIYGIRPSVYTDLALALIADGFLILISAIIVVNVISDGNFTLEPLSPANAPDDFTGLSLAVAFGVLIFLGFEQSFVLGEEVTDPHGNVPKAIYTALGLVGFVLFSATFALVLGFGEAGIGQLNELFGSEGTPWFALVREEIGSGWVDVLLVMIVLSILSNTIASHNAVVRIQYGMGRAGALPRQLGRTLPGRRTPHIAIAAQMTLAVAVTLFFGLVWSETSLFSFLGFMIGLAAALSFILIAVAALAYFRRTARNASPWRNYVVPVVAILILTPVVITSFEPSPGHPLKWAPFVILGWVIAGAAYLIYRERRHERIDIDYAFRAAGEEPPADEPLSPGRAPAPPGQR